MSESQLLVIVVPVEIKDDLVDALMGLAGISGFNLAKIAGYSKEHSQFSVREQVEGHRELYRFEIMHERDQQEGLLLSLQGVCGAARLRYWITPVLSHGHFSVDRKASYNDGV